MKKRRVLIIISGCLAVAVIVSLLWPREREPEYNGVALSEWLERYDRAAQSLSINEVPAASKAFDAIDRIGTNALPFLVRWIQYERPAWRQRVYDLSWNLPNRIVYSRTLSRLLALGEKSHRAENACGAFLILGRKAADAVPQLKRLAEKRPMDETSYRAVACLEFIEGSQRSAQ